MESFYFGIILFWLDYWIAISSRFSGNTVAIDSVRFDTRNTRALVHYVPAAHITCIGRDETELLPRNLGTVLSGTTGRYADLASECWRTLKEEGERYKHIVPNSDNCFRQSQVGSDV